MPEQPPLHPHPVDRLLAAADPAPSEVLATEEIATALDAICASVVRAHRRDRGRQRRHRFAAPRRAFIVGIALLVLGGAATAATRLLTAHTGIYPTQKWEIQAGGPGEELNLAAPDGRTVALHASSDIPFPSGFDAWRQWLVTIQIRESAPRPCPPSAGRGMCPSVVSTGALRGWFAMSAFCAWVVDWRGAAVAGDRPEMARGAKAIAGAHHWKAIDAESATDPRLFAWMAPYVPAVSAGDRGHVDRLLRSNAYGSECWQYDPGFARSIDGRANPGASYLRFLAAGHA